VTCPSEAELQSLQHGEPSAPVLEHVRGCSSCQARLDTLAATLESDPARRLPTDSVAPGVKVGPYVVTRRLGAGAMGSVSAAWDARLEREVALKVLHLDSDALVNEARLLARLNHPNVVTVHEVTEWNGRIVLVMENARGRSLRDWLAEQRRTPREILEVFSQCAAGLEAAHQAGIIHRDFKPDNALVDDTGRARVLDFGLATPAIEAGAGLAGSPAYMALAQLQGSPADARSDQFAWWVSLYEALVGRRPHDGKTLEALIDARQGPLDLSPLPRWLRAPMARGLSRQPGDRFPSMEAAARALRPPRTAQWLALSAALLAVVGVSVVVARPASACEGLPVQPGALLARATGPALRDAVEAYGAAVERCRALPREEQVGRAACLDVSGHELDVGLEALSRLPSYPAELQPRILRRVIPPSRCERAPLPRTSRWDDAERPALLESVQAQLEFDALRTADRQVEALALAQQHRARADASQVVTARAWARINEAAALSVSARVPEAVALLREIEGLTGLHLREETWASLSRWLFECYLGDDERCGLQRQRAQRVSNELDEPWSRAFEKEVGMRYLNVPVEEVVAAWGAIPGAGPEVARAMANEVGNVQAEDTRFRILRALTLARSIARPDARARMLMMDLESLIAVHDGDLARARELLRQMEAEPLDTPAADQARHLARERLLFAGQRWTEALALAPSNGKAARARYRDVLTRMELLHRLGDPGYAEARRQVELIEPNLSASELAWLETVRVRIALREGDAKALRALPFSEDTEVLRDWQLAVLEHDVTKQRELLAETSAPDETAWDARVLQVEGLLAAGQLEAAADAAARLREVVPSIEVLGRVRLLEARARAALGDAPGACRVMTRHVLESLLLPAERARAEQFVRECPVVGISNDPG
jgi:predicted Ser/Thr protein kinase